MRQIVTKSIICVTALAALSPTLVGQTSPQRRSVAATHSYAKADPNEAKQFLRDLLKQKRIPDLPPIGLKAGQRWDAENAIERSTPQAIRIDGQQWVILWAAVPIVQDGSQNGAGRVEVSQVLQKFGEVEHAFTQNGIFISTVDLQYSDGEVVRAGTTPTRTAFLPKGEYVWFIGKTGALLTGGRLDWEPLGIPRYKAEPTYWLKFKAPLRAFPAGTFVLLFEVTVIPDGFRFGPKTITIVPMESTDRMDPLPTLRFRAVNRQPR